MKQDRFLIGILAFLVILSVGSLVLFFTHRSNLEYGNEDTPEGVVRNYVLALQKGDYLRAYGYLAEKEYKPSYSSFEQAFLSNPSSLDTAGVRLGSTMQSGSQAWVEVTVIYAGADGPFSGGRWSNVEKASLVQQNGKWKITYMPYPYWSWGWYEKVEPVPAGD